MVTSTSLTEFFSPSSMEACIVKKNYLKIIMKVRHVHRKFEKCIRVKSMENLLLHHLYAFFFFPLYLYFFLGIFCLKPLAIFLLVCCL